MARKWYCSRCGEDFTRRYSCRRHIFWFHPGQAEPVRGFQKGSTTKPNQQGSLDLSYLDIMDQEAGNSHSLNSSSVSLTWRDSPKPLSASIGHKKVQHVGVDFGGIDGRRMMRKTYERLEDTWVDRMLGRGLVSGSAGPRIQPQLLPFDPALLGDVFAYTSHFCDECKMWEPLEVYFTELTNNNSEQRGHICYSKTLAMSINGMVIPKGRASGLLKNGGVSLLRDFLKPKWSSNGTHFYLSARQVSISLNDQKVSERTKKDETGTMLKNISGPRLIFQLPNPKKLKQQHVILSCDKNEECVLLIRPKDPSHWLNRVLNDYSKSVWLTIEEVDDFLICAKGATYVFVEVPADAEPNAGSAQLEGRNQKGTSAKAFYYLLVLWDKNLLLPNQEVIQDNRNNARDGPHAAVPPKI